MCLRPSGRKGTCPTVPPAELEPQQHFELRAWTHAALVGAWVTFVFRLDFGWLCRCRRNGALNTRTQEMRCWDHARKVLTVGGGAVVVEEMTTSRIAGAFRPVSDFRCVISCLLFSHVVFEFPRSFRAGGPLPARWVQVSVDNDVTGALSGCRSSRTCCTSTTGARCGCPTPTPCARTGGWCSGRTGRDRRCTRPSSRR